MKTKEKFIEEKREAIAEQAALIKRCVYMIKRTSKYSKPKHIITHHRRALRIFSYAMTIKACVVEINIIMAQTQSESLPIVGNLFDN